MLPLLSRLSAVQAKPSCFSAPLLARTHDQRSEWVRMTWAMARMGRLVRVSAWGPVEDTEQVQDNSSSLEGYELPLPMYCRFRLLDVRFAQVQRIRYMQVTGKNDYDISISWSKQMKPALPQRQKSRFETASKHHTRKGNLAKAEASIVRRVASLKFLEFELQPPFGGRLGILVRWTACCASRVLGR